MPTTIEVSYRLYGAWRLLRLDRGGMAFFDGSIQSFWNSFFAAVLVLPVYAINVLLSLSEGEPVAGTFAILLVHAIAYVISWTAFPVVVHEVAERLDRSERYTTFIVAFNWAKVIQMALYLPALLLAILGFAKGLTGLLFVLIAFAVLGYQWFVARVALDLTGAAAAGVVALDLVLGVLVTWYANAIIF